LLVAPRTSDAHTTAVFSELLEARKRVTVKKACPGLVHVRSEQRARATTQTTLLGLPWRPIARAAPARLRVTLVRQKQEWWSSQQKSFDGEQSQQLAATQYFQPSIESSHEYVVQFAEFVLQ